MKPRNPMSNTYESAEFKQSAAYHDYLAAMQAVGCAKYADVLAASRVVRDRFHAVWTEKMSVRIGSDTSPKKDRQFVLDPTLVDKPGRVGRVARNYARVRQMHAEGASDRDMAAAIGISKSRVMYIRKALNLAPTGAIGRNALLRPKVEEMVRAGHDDPEIARHMGITLNVVGHLRRSLGLPRAAKGDLTRTTHDKRRRALELTREGVAPSRIAERLGINQRTAQKWVASSLIIDQAA